MGVVYTLGTILATRPSLQFYGELGLADSVDGAPERSGDRAVLSRVAVKGDDGRLCPQGLERWDRRLKRRGAVEPNGEQGRVPRARC